MTGEARRCGMGGRSTSGPASTLLALEEMEKVVVEVLKRMTRRDTLSQPVRGESSSRGTLGAHRAEPDLGYPIHPLYPSCASLFLRPPRHTSLAPPQGPSSTAIAIKFSGHSPIHQ
jgi:hypothetical protein